MTAGPGDSSRSVIGNVTAAGMGGEDARWVDGARGKCTRCDNHEALRRLVAVGDDGARREVASLAPHRQLRAARRALSATRAA